MKNLAIALLSLALVPAGCAGMDKVLLLAEANFPDHWEHFGTTVRQAAAEGGFHELLSEARPAPSNHWRGELVFFKTTTFGTDRLVVRTTGTNRNVEVRIRGAAAYEDGGAVVDAIARALAATGYTVARADERHD